MNFPQNVTWSMLCIKLKNGLKSEIYLSPLQTRFGDHSAMNITGFFDNLNMRAIFTGINAKSNLLILLDVLQADSDNVPPITTELKSHVDKYFP